LEWCNHNKNQDIKAKQLLELQRHCLFEVVGGKKYQRIHILKVYEEPTTDKPLYYPNNDIYGNHDQVLIPQHLLVDGKLLIYKVQYGNVVYIGSTKLPRQRISQHFRGFVNKHTYEMLQKGGTFELIEVVNGTEEQLRAKETEYIKEYVSTGVYIVINEKHNSTKE